MKLPLYSNRKLKRPALIGFIGIACAAGLVAVFIHAAGSFITAEPENGALTGAATIGTDAAASGTKYVQFASAASAFTISISGNHFVDGNGNTVQLRGVNRSGTQYACAEGWGLSDGPVDDAAINNMKAWGMNAVRVNGNEDCWLAINGVPTQYAGANYQAFMGALVNRFIAHGMYVILDLHHSAPGTTLALGQQAMADRDHSPAYWASVANYFKNNHAVIFDLYNEPHPDSNHDTTAAWTCLRDGGTCSGVSFTAAGMQELVTAVRGAGAVNPIIIGGPQYAGTLTQWTQYKPTDPANQIAAAIHIYYNTPASPDWSPCYLQSCWDNIMAPLATTTPIVLGEVGEHDCDYGLIYGTSLSPTQQNLLTWADAHGVSYTPWSWIAGNCAGEPALISNYDGTPSNYGIGIKNHLLSLPH
jgi:endoglucanase